MCVHDSRPTLNWTRAPRIAPAEYGRRLEGLQAAVRGAGLAVHLVSAFDSIYYLTGTGFEPLERPFFLLVWPDRPPALVVPRLDREHMQQRARTVAPDNVHTYWEYPAPGGRTWLDRLRVLLGSARAVGVEPGLRLDLRDQLAEWAPRAEPLVDRLRMVKSPAEVAMVRRAAHYADLGVERLLAASYAGSTVAEGFAQTRAVTARIIREVDDWEPLTTRVTMATWAAPAARCRTRSRPCGTGWGPARMWPWCSRG